MNKVIPLSRNIQIAKYFCLQPHKIVTPIPTNELMKNARFWFAKAKKEKPELRMPTINISKYK
jgi:hypothetical protein